MDVNLQGKMYNEAITRPSNHTATCSNNSFLASQQYLPALLIVGRYISEATAQTDQTIPEHSQMIS